MCEAPGISADHNLQVKQWARILPKRALDLVTVNTTSYKVWSATGRLSSEHHITPGDIQRQHQSLSRSAEIAQVFVLAQHGLISILSICVWPREKRTTSVKTLVEFA